MTGLAFMLLVYFMNRNVLRRRMGKGQEPGSGELRLRIPDYLFPGNSHYFYPPLSTTPAPTWTAISFPASRDFTVSAEIRSPLPTEEFSNYYLPVINIPLAMASASASAMMPEVSSDFALGKNREAQPPDQSDHPADYVHQHSRHGGHDGFWQSPLWGCCSRLLPLWRPTC